MPPPNLPPETRNSPKLSDDARLAVMETQIGRLVSDVESEKRTRAETTRDMKEAIQRVSDNLANSHTRLSDNLTSAHKELSGHLAKQDEAQSRMKGGLIVINVIFAAFWSAAIAVIIALMKK